MITKPNGHNGGQINALAMQSDGKIVTAGLIADNSGFSKNCCRAI